jgi:outer membrane lipoprotein-sorting protein
MRKPLVGAWAFLLGATASLAPSLPAQEKNRVQEVAEKMKAVFRGVEDYSSEVEQIYFKNGAEKERYRFKYYFKKPHRIRVEFIAPHPGLIVFYQGGEKQATLRPFPSLPALEFNLSIDSSILKTPTGQSINQTDMVFFIGFLFRNLAGVPQQDDQFEEQKDQVNFLFWGRDYVKGETPEKYHIFISRQSWFPVRIERYSPGGKPMEISIIRNYVFNSHPADAFFIP